MHPIPDTGAVFIDSRGDARAMRVSWHHESGVVVLSMWRENVCVGTFRLPAEDVPELVDLLRGGLDEAYDAIRTDELPEPFHERTLERFDPSRLPQQRPGA
ncbi:hypothetical protein [Nocardioides speluncae]|uniref:hypothetical protein n=1 Tax=Nocardioides speluncae TaxID=2670337 RepID=UPI00197FAD0F|nr:hypothetical protein [Nocardioides speluncae]